MIPTEKELEAMELDAEKAKRLTENIVASHCADYVLDLIAAVRSLQAQLAEERERTRRQQEALKAVLPWTNGYLQGVSDEQKREAIGACRERTYTRSEVLELMRRVLDAAKQKCGKGLARANIATIDPAALLDAFEKEGK